MNNQRRKALGEIAMNRYPQCSSCSNNQSNGICKADNKPIKTEEGMILGYCKNAKIIVVE